MRADDQSPVSGAAGRGDDRIAHALKLTENLAVDPETSSASEARQAFVDRKGLGVTPSRPSLPGADRRVGSRPASRIAGEPVRTRHPDTRQQSVAATSYGIRPHLVHSKPIHFKPVQSEPTRFASPPEPAPAIQTEAEVGTDSDVPAASVGKLERSRSWLRRRLRGRAPGYALMIAAALMSVWQARDVASVVDGARWIRTAFVKATKTVGAPRNPDLRSAMLDVTSSLPAAKANFNSAVQLPTAYGIYAASDGNLIRLESMRMRVPDPRIAIPSVITKPSQVVLPDGQISFVAYQRDLAEMVPDGAYLRVVAKVARDLHYSDSGKPLVGRVADMWAIRAISIELKVTPVAGNREMVLIRPERSHLPVSPGRYMLVFNKQVYDFTIDGQTTDRSHCLERSETLDGTIYSECSAGRGMLSNRP